MAVGPEQRFELSLDEIREVARYAADCAADVLAVFEAADPEDPRPRAAVEAARAFADGAPRGRWQRVAAVEAHRAAREVASEPGAHAARAAGDAAAAAYLHPFSASTQVGHILGAAAQAARCAELVAGDPGVGDRCIDDAAARATPLLLDVLRRYPPAPAGRTRVAQLMRRLDLALRPELSGGPAPPPRR